MSDLVIRPSRGLRGEIELPGDKSISHRSVLFAAIAEGKTHITGFLTGEDTMNTAKAVRALGIGVDGLGTGSRVAHGKWQARSSELQSLVVIWYAVFCLKKLAGLLAGQ